MKRRKFEVSERWKQIVGFSILGGVLFGLFLDAKSEPLVFINEVQATTTEQVVQIEVRVDWTPERIEQEIRNTFPEAPNTAVAIAKAESELNIKAYNPEAHIGCNGSIGIMQIACVHNRKDPKALFDVKTNIETARRVYDASGGNFSAWGAYSSGAYRFKM